MNFKMAEYVYNAALQVGSRTVRRRWSISEITFMMN